MNKISIFCEGVTDQIFIADCIEHFFGISVTRNVTRNDNVEMYFPNGGRIIGVGGCTNLKKDIYLNMLRDNSEEGGQNIVIFDADFSQNANGDKKGNGNNGFENACRKLNAISSSHKVSFDFYLWHNNTDDGEIEHLLHQLIPSDKREIFDCIRNYQNCLQKVKYSVRTADYKQQLEYYLYTLFQESKPRCRNYRDLGHWNLDYTSIQDLLSFKTYLDKFFTNII